MEYRAGTRLKSVVCTTEIVIVKPPVSGAILRCGGAPMVSVTDPTPPGPTIADDPRGGTQVGKRYVTDGVEVLCTKRGEGSLALDDMALELQGAKPLPPSD